MRRWAAVGRAEQAATVHTMVVVRLVSRPLTEAGSDLGRGVASIDEEALALSVFALSRRRLGRVLVRTLARACAADPGQPVPWTELAAAVWPGERMRPASAKNRLKVAIAWLRNAGFREILLSDTRGYWLQPGLRIEFL